MCVLSYSCIKEQISPTMDGPSSALRPNYDLLSHYENELVEGLQSFQVSVEFSQHVPAVVGSAACNRSQC